MPSIVNAVNESRIEALPNLSENSYLQFNPKDNLGLTDAEFQDGMAFIQDQFDHLPPDPVSDIKDGRFRTYSRAIIMPWEEPCKIHWLPGYEGKGGEEYTIYNQGEFNPEHAHEYRYFPALPEACLHLRLLENLIMTDVALCDWNDDELRHPIVIGVHFIKTSPSPENPVAKTTPNALHQDGHKFSFVHLVKRRNVKGGENVIATVEHRDKQPDDVPDEDIVDQFYLRNELDSWAAYDKHVSHYAGPVMQDVKGHIPSERSVMIFDIEPMRAAND